MTVQELVSKLSELPQDKEVRFWEVGCGWRLMVEDIYFDPPEGPDSDGDCYGDTVEIDLLFEENATHDLPTEVIELVEALDACPAFWKLHRKVKEGKVA